MVGVHLLGEERSQVEDDLIELKTLLRTLQIETVGQVIQRRQRLVARSLLGSGKIEEIAELARTRKAEMIVFDRELTAMQVRNLEKLTGLQVFDRTGVILEIFSEHARTNQAKTQVEIAKLEYLLPRLSGAWTHFQRQKGGRVRARGMGEKQIEVDRRRARERMIRLQRQLEDISKDKRNQAKARRKELKVALVGYTNSGKTTLMSHLTKGEFVPRDELFATLDASIKVIDPRTRPKILLSDTVGFIRNLPHSLVESFKSTLDHVCEADLLLHVVDASYPKYRDHIETTNRVLAEIGADHIPTILVLNKIDQIEDPYLPRILRQAHERAVTVSAHNLNQVMELREQIYAFFQETMVRARVEVRHNDNEILSLIYNSCLVLEADYGCEDRVVFDLQAPQPTIARLAPYVSLSAL